MASDALRSEGSSPGPVVLGFDTSAAHCAAAVVSGGRVLARRVEPMDRGQAERLMPLLEETLAEAGLGWGDIDRIAVGVGPGTFTGVRLAVAAARGLALALSRPALGVTRFAALAEGVVGPVVVTIAAPRDQVCVQVLRDGVEEGAPALVPLAAVAVPAGALCLGDGAEAVAARSGARAGAVASAPDPAAIARIGARMPADGPRPAPLYLRPPDAAPSAEPPPRILDDDAEAVGR